MRQPATGQPTKRAVSRITRLPAPVKGWSSQYSIADAPRDTAAVMDNFFPEADAVRVRHGCTLQSSGLGASVNSLLVYNSQTGGNKLFGAANGNIYDCTTGGAVGAAVVSGKSNAVWQQEMFSTAGGQFLVICNGVDGVMTFDGTSWVNQTASITGTGGAVNSFIQVCAHKQRLWFTPDNSTTVWYLGTSSIAGAATQFPVGAFLKMGGKVIGCATWSSNTAYNMDDYLLILSDQGEGLIYGGTDPTSSSTWGLKFRIYVGRPLTNRCFMTVGGDLILLTELGALPVSQVLDMDAAVLSDKAITKNIRTAYNTAVQNSRTQFGWCMTSLPQANMAILNVPGSGSTVTQQFVMNTVTGAWGRFFGWTANCWAYLAGAVYYGDGSGNVLRAEYGPNDNGVAISTYLLPAFGDLGSPGHVKYVSMVKPTVYADITQNYSVGVGADYNVPTVSTTTPASTSGWFTWDTSFWDGPALWRGSSVSIAWSGQANIGTMISPAFAMNLDGTGAASNFNFRIYSFDIVYETGGVL